MIAYIQSASAQWLTVLIVWVAALLVYSWFPRIHTIPEATQ